MVLHILKIRSVSLRQQGFIVQLRPAVCLSCERHHDDFFKMALVFELVE